jgi:hypothetical protein
VRKKSKKLVRKKSLIGIMIRYRSLPPAPLLEGHIRHVSCV